MQTSDHYNGKIFLNPVPTDVMAPGTFLKILGKYFQKHPNREPLQPLGPFAVNHSVLQNVPPQKIRFTWLGHSSLIIEVDGKRFLTDPLWYNRVSPFKYVGPKRFFANPIGIDDLPPIDAILLSHDHYDHLDKQSLLHLTKKGIPVITMLGVGKRLIDWGVSKDLVTELDWWQQKELVDGFLITATPSRHFSGRWLTDRFTTLWGSFVIKSPQHTIFFGADSGYYNGFTTIAERLGPFDVALLEIGAYNEHWEAIHMGPEKAVQAAIDLGRPLLLPIHWGTFSLAFHPWKEPVERLLAEASTKEIQLLLPVPGETVVATGKQYINRWWEKF